MFGVQGGHRVTFEHTNKSSVRLTNKVSSSQQIWSEEQENFKHGHQYRPVIDRQLPQYNRHNARRVSQPSGEAKTRNQSNSQANISLNGTPTSSNFNGCNPDFKGCDPYKVEVVHKKPQKSVGRTRLPIGKLLWSDVGHQQAKNKLVMPMHFKV